jgi:hypothetical protein
MTLGIIGVKGFEKVQRQQHVRRLRKGEWRHDYGLDHVGVLQPAR